VNAVLPSLGGNGAQAGESNGLVVLQSFVVSGVPVATEVAVTTAKAAFGVMSRTSVRRLS